MIKAAVQSKQGARYSLSGNVEIDYGTFILRADDVEYDSDSGTVVAEGRVSLDGGPNDEHILASRAEYNLNTETGRFSNVTGGVGVQVKPGKVALTSDNPFTFSAELLEKTTPEHYRISDGTVTTCQLPKPKWQFRAREISVELGGNAKIYNSTFMLYGLPILYMPYATHPADRTPRHSGFLVPNIGQSSIKGTILGESAYLTLGRSVDLTAGAEYFSLRGWAPQAQLRIRPSQNSFFDLSFYSVFDRGIGTPRVNQGGTDAHLAAGGMLPYDIRGVADIEYLSSFLFRLAFNDVFTQAVNSEVKSSAFLTKSSSGYFSNLAVRRYQDFESATPGDVVTILHAPSLDLLSVDHQLGASPFYWSYDGSFGGVSRSDPVFSTANLVGRFDFSPTVSAPFSALGWSIRPSLTARDTFYGEQLATVDSTPSAEPESINRRSVEGQIEVRPPEIARTFPRPFLGRKWRHVVDPQITYRYVTGVDNFSKILRFDERDILSNTNEVEYRLTNRFFAKRLNEKTKDCSPGMPSLFIGGAVAQSQVPWERRPLAQSQDACLQEPAIREVLVWELAQKYFLDPTFGGALVPGQPNTLTTTEDLTGVAFLTEQRRLSPLISRLRFEPSDRSSFEWDVDYDFHLSHINSSSALFNYRIGPFTLGGGDFFLQAPGENLLSSSTPLLFNQFRALAGYGYPNKRGLSAAASAGFDETLKFLQYGSIQTSYNWDCCGMTLEYRRFALGSVRNENQYRFTFSLANIGSFGNLRRDSRLF